MAVKVYVSNTSGNIWMKGEQDHIHRVLESKSIEFEQIDIADPHYKNEKEFMQNALRLTDEDLVALPPQIFTNNTYKGDYNGFFKALEMEQLFHYLGIEAPPGEVEYELQQGGGTLGGATAV